jgi:hypothetical protein
MIGGLLPAGQLFHNAGEPEANAADMTEGANGLYN